MQHALARPSRNPTSSPPVRATDGFDFLVFATNLKAADVCDVVRHQSKVVVVLDLDNTLVDAMAVAVSQKDWWVGVYAWLRMCRADAAWLSSAAESLAAVQGGACDWKAVVVRAVRDWRACVRLLPWGQQQGCSKM